ncbi:hypothetical protein SAY86_011966 [Trapa natans]|uniref:Uncharacterized protein n=1 Tax=Trapa natans TaxID=22666 RepID=A0AAN7M984_TRANT|nr:hypothetical protein SAY86_011966 [Trapa natans]
MKKMDGIKEMQRQMQMQMQEENLKKPPLSLCQPRRTVQWVRIKDRSADKKGQELDSSNSRESWPVSADVILRTDMAEQYPCHFDLLFFVFVCNAASIWCKLMPDAHKR